MNRHIEFYYFSGSGNTEFVMSFAVQALRETGVQITLRPIEKGYVFSNTIHEIWIAFPVNSQFASPFIWRFIKSLPLGNGINVYAIVTLNESAYVLEPLHSHLKHKGYIPVAACEVSMPNNMVASIFDPKLNHERIDAACEKLSQFILDYSKGNHLWKTEFQGSKLTSFLSRETPLPWMFMRLIFRLETISTKCIRCGTCVKQCPVNNIKMIDLELIHGHRCEFCIKCASSCPNKAIKVHGKEHIEIHNTSVSNDMTEWKEVD